MPESVPTPYIREHAADSAETAKRLRSLLGKDKAELLDIHREDIPTVADTCRNSPSERIAVMLNAEIIVFPADSDAHDTLVSDEEMRLT